MADAAPATLARRSRDPAATRPDMDDPTTTPATDSGPSDPDAADDASRALANRLYEGIAGAFDLVGVYLGDQLGWYRSLADDGPATPTALAARTDTDARYAREWLEQQATTGFLLVDPATIDGDDPDAAVFSLPAAHRPVLLDPESLLFSAPMAQQGVGAIAMVPRLVSAFRTGTGVPFADYGRDLREGEARSTRPVYRRLLAGWLAGIPSVERRLREEPPARVADLGCGQGESTLAIARAYPTARVDGLDLDPASIEAARELHAAGDIGDRVRFVLADAADPALGGRYDLVTMFEMFHDLAHPVEALVAARALLASDGAILIADELTEETFTGPAGTDDQVHYGWSIVHCLPAARPDATAAATGTVIRPATVRRYAAAAGIGSVEILPIESDSWRFYLLRP
jgi:SAM-dependent methyltransferase